MLISLLICFSLAKYETDPDDWNNVIQGCSYLKEDSDFTIASTDTELVGYLNNRGFALCTQGVAKKITISVDIPAEAFYGSTKVHSVELTSDVTSIGNGAFCGCTNLNLALNFNAALNEIGEGAFQGCIQLTGNIEFHGSEIKANAFRDCSQLKDL